MPDPATPPITIPSSAAIEAQIATLKEELSWLGKLLKLAHAREIANGVVNAAVTKSQPTEN